MDMGVFDGDSDSLSFPDDTVVGILDDPDAANGAVGDLVSGGLAEDRIQVLCFDSGARRLDPSGKRHGVLGRLQRLVQNFGDEEIPHIERQAAALRDGKFIVAAHAGSEEERDQVAGVLKAHGGHFINYYTGLTVQRLEA